MTRSRAGLALTIPAGLLGFLFGGWPGTLSAVSFGLLAMLIQVAAGHRMSQQEQAPLREYMLRWVSGMGLRLFGVALVGVVIWQDSARFPPIPAAMGYVGVLVPLLFLEARQA